MSNGRIDFARSEHINDVALSRIRKGIGRQGDILLSHKGTVGKLARVPVDAPPFVCSPQTTFWRVLNGRRLDRGYLYAFMRSRLFETQLASVQGETDMAPYVSLTAQRRLKIAVPSLREQVAVGDLFGALDDKIELNRRIVETLGALAQALFKSWFIDFDPVRAKAEGQSTGLPDELAALFPDSLDENGVPAGWRSSAGAIGELVRWMVDPAEVEPTTPYIGLEHLERRKLLVERWGSAQDVDSAKATFRAGDLLFGKLRPYFHKVAVASSEGICSSDIFVFRPRAGVPRSFLYMSFSQADFVESASNASSGTRMPRADWSYMRQLPAILPPAALLAAFDGIVSTQIDAMLSKASQSCTVAAVRDTLLPKIISGELSIADAEERIAAA